MGSRFSLSTASDLNGLERRMWASGHHGYHASIQSSELSAIADGAVIRPARVNSIQLDAPRRGLFSYLHAAIISLV